MAKKIIFESFKYRFLIAAHDVNYLPIQKGQPEWHAFLKDLEFVYDNGTAIVSWKHCQPGHINIELSDLQFYVRGDSPKNIEKQKSSHMLFNGDPIKLKNDLFFKKTVSQVAQLAGYDTSKSSANNNARTKVERDFHDAWANSENLDAIDILVSNEACTAPEMRWITKSLGDLKGKKLLDVGCGLGEASVYFAMLGADVTSSDLSQGMLDATARLANTAGVTIKQHISSAEDLQLGHDEKFDIIYAGNLLHHVNIEETLTRVKPHLAENGIFVSWDPIAYNPAINAYRAIATDVRTPDEHPLTWTDIKLFRKHFKKVETKYFWLTTLIIFIIMFLAQRRNPNKERFWKVIVQEGNKWAWLYGPLGKIDRVLLAVFPPLRLLCWNVVIVAKSPHKGTSKHK